MKHEAPSRVERRRFFDGDWPWRYRCSMGAQQRIGVLAGGLSGQRALSMRAGEAIVAALGQAGHVARLLYVDREIDLSIRQERIDVAFLALRGRYAGDGCTQGLLELLGVPYTGPGVLPAALAMNKARSKDVLRLHNLPTLPAYVVDSEADEQPASLHGAFGFPAIVRPVGAGPGLGVSVARHAGDLPAAFELAFRHDGEAIVERPFEGRIVSVALLGGKVLGALEPDAVSSRAAGGVGGKARAGGPRLGAARLQTLSRLASQTSEALGLADGATIVDVLVGDAGKEAVVEVDAAPVLTPDGTFSRVALRAGLTFSAMLEELLAGARLRGYGRRRERRGEPPSPFPGLERRSTLIPSAH